MLNIRDSPENTRRSKKHRIPRNPFEEVKVENAVLLRVHVGDAKVNAMNDVVLIKEYMRFHVVLWLRPGDEYKTDVAECKTPFPDGPHPKWNSEFTLRLKDPWECDSLYVEVIWDGAYSNPGTSSCTGIAGRVQVPLPGKLGKRKGGRYILDKFVGRGETRTGTGAEAEAISENKYKSRGYITLSMELCPLFTRNGRDEYYYTRRAHN
ncbi:C2 domain containing protein [Parasponia andersonii]|uniref:C2 domain containing protein n=1 Tax=Parasponia andersonii TaxID=3476 RepID=A0A2P5D6Z8_PARAD|nr:C2 domain containing protein [Parasponia andersonii]